MYSITEILLIQLLCFFIVDNLPKYIRHFPDINISKILLLMMNFFIFICENNPLILNYYDMYDLVEDGNDNRNEIIKQEEVIKQEEAIKQEGYLKEVKFEEKYLEKFKKFPNEYQFTELELEDEKKEYIQIKENTEKKSFEEIQEIKNKLQQIYEIENNSNVTNDTKDLNEYGINKILIYFDLEEEYEDDPDDIDIEELYVELLKTKCELEKNLLEIESKLLTDDDYYKLAREKIINKKLDKYIDNYVLEYTPLGNIYMRYNNDKKSFEYFSNNTIPYRYLEPVGRKYVMTYWCKPIFVDIDEELKRAELRYDEEKKIKDDKERRREEEKKNNPKNILAQLKNYNKDTKEQTMRPMKNKKNYVLPPQIQANLPDVNTNKQTEKQLLKENANRYTWEGRLTNFCPLKKIDKKVLDKKLTMSYAEFKKMQQHQNKK